MRNLTAAGLIFVIVPIILAQGATASTEEMQALPAAEQVLERYIEAVGGRETIASLTTRVSLGRMIHDLHWSRPPYEVVPIAGYATSSDHMLMVEHKSGGVRCEGFDGETAWVQDASGIAVSESPVRSKTAWLLDPQGALRMEKYFPGLEVTSKENLDGRTVYVIEPAELDRAHYALYFDAETGLLVRVGYYWELKDYRDVDGVRLPFRIDMSRKGGSSTIVLDFVKHNLPLDKPLFAVPDGAEATGE